MQIDRALSIELSRHGAARRVSGGGDRAIIEIVTADHPQRVLLRKEFPAGSAPDVSLVEATIREFIKDRPYPQTREEQLVQATQDLSGKLTESRAETATIKGERDTARAERDAATSQLAAEAEARTR